MKAIKDSFYLSKENLFSLAGSDRDWKSINLNNGEA